MSYIENNGSRKITRTIKISGNWIERIIGTSFCKIIKIIWKIYQT
jgi:hypothetical protein